eukprot:SAG11_NODE_8505_length_1008_cov_1.306931_1_plen_49_part_10
MTDRPHVPSRPCPFKPPVHDPGLCGAHWVLQVGSHYEPRREWRTIANQE